MKTTPPVRFVLSCRLLLLLSIGAFTMLLAHPAISQRPSPVPMPTSPTTAPVPIKILDSIRQDAIGRGDMPTTAKVVRTESTSLRELNGIPWISATIPKWKITLATPDQQWVYIASDSTFLFASRDALNLPKALSPQAIQAVRRSAAHYWHPQLPNRLPQIRSEQILIQKVEAVTWKDSCLELSLPSQLAGATTCTKQPTPGWRITLLGVREPLPINATTGKVAPTIGFRPPAPTLTFRIDRSGQQIKPDIPATAANLAFATATEWGLPQQQGQLIGAAVTHWGRGCENLNGLPHPCDPVPTSGWFVKIEQQQQRWTVRVDRDDNNRDNNNNATLISRENIVLDNSFDTQFATQAKILAASHLEITPEQVLLTQVQAENFGACLGLPLPIEKCGADPGQGYRISVVGKPGQTQTYRVSYRSGIRTEPTDGLPLRTDRLPTRLAKILFQDARSRLKTPIAQLHIATVEDNKGKRQVVVTNFRQQLKYEVDGTGKILSVKA
jgi:hypothetical protein